MTVAWQQEEKRLTPDEVQAVTFPLSRIGRRGFDEDHVRAFLQEVEREIVTRLNEKVSLWNEVERPADRRPLRGGRAGLQPPAHRGGQEPPRRDTERSSAACRPGARGGHDPSPRGGAG